MHHARCAVPAAAAEPGFPGEAGAAQHRRGVEQGGGAVRPGPCGCPPAEGPRCHPAFRALLSTSAVVTPVNRADQACPLPDASAQLQTLQNLALCSECNTTSGKRAACTMPQSGSAGSAASTICIVC